MSSLRGITSSQSVYNQSQRGGGSNLLLPRSRFNFYVEVQHIGNSAPNPLILERISEVQMPGHIFKTAVMNQYNRKRIINTGIDYTPVYINAYDTRDNQIFDFLKEYTQHYFKGPMDTTGSSELNYNDLTQLDFAGFGNTGSGKGLNIVQDRNFIKSIKIVRDDGDSGQKQQVTLYAPFITGISGDTLAYSDSNPAQVRIELSYEGYDVES